MKTVKIAYDTDEKFFGDIWKIVVSIHGISVVYCVVRYSR